MAQVIRKSDKAAYARLEKVSKQLSGSELKVGWFETNRYPDGTPVAYIATIHEFGYPEGGIPARPFMRPTIVREENFWRKFIDQEAKKIYDGRQTVENMLEALGLSIAGEVARSITQVMAPPLKPATIAAKKRKLADAVTVGSLDKPLVETGLMLASVTHVVEKS